LQLYKRLNYNVVGELTDFPAGEKKYFLQKSLRDSMLDAG